MSDRDQDAVVRALLREHSPEPPTGDVDWSALHERITDRARPLLRRAPLPRWWEPLAGWARPAIPAAAAAILAGVIMLGTVLRPEPAAVAAAEFVVIEEELAASLGGTSVSLLAGGDVDVIEALMFNDGEEW